MPDPARKWAADTSTVYLLPDNIRVVTSGSKATRERKQTLRRYDILATTGFAVRVSVAREHALAPAASLGLHAATATRHRTRVSAASPVGSAVWTHVRGASAADGAAESLPGGDGAPGAQWWEAEFELAPAFVAHVAAGGDVPKRAVVCLLMELALAPTPVPLRGCDGQWKAAVRLMRGDAPFALRRHLLRRLRLAPEGAAVACEKTDGVRCVIMAVETAEAVAGAALCTLLVPGPHKDLVHSAVSRGPAAARGVPTLVAVHRDGRAHVVVTAGGRAPLPTGVMVDCEYVEVAEQAHGPGGDALRARRAYYVMFGYASTDRPGAHVHGRAAEALLQTMTTRAAALTTAARAPPCMATFVVKRWVDLGQIPLAQVHSAARGVAGPGTACAAPVDGLLVEMGGRTYKWKPRHAVSVDVRLAAGRVWVADTSTAGPGLDLTTQLPGLGLHAGTDAPDEPCGSLADVPGLADGCFGAEPIVEVGADAEALGAGDCNVWRFRRVRTDRATPNFVLSAMDALQQLAEAISAADLCQCIAGRRAAFRGKRPRSVVRLGVSKRARREADT